MVPPICGSFSRVPMNPLIEGWSVSHQTQQIHFDPCPPSPINHHDHPISRLQIFLRPLISLCLSPSPDLYSFKTPTTLVNHSLFAGQRNRHHSDPLIYFYFPTDPFRFRALLFFPLSLHQLYQDIQPSITSLSKRPRGHT